MASVWGNPWSRFQLIKLGVLPKVLINFHLAVECIFKAAS